MDSYTVTSEMAGYGSKQMPKRILTMAILIIAVEIFVFQWKAHFGEHFKSESFVIEVVSGLAGAVLAELWEVGRKYPFTLVVSDDFIKAVYPSRERSIRKNEIRSVKETEGSAFRVAALQISKYGRLGTRLWGCILVPKALPEYESVRSVALSWKHPTGI